MTADTKEYIGDGIYAAFDGFALILTTENGEEVTNIIVFEPRQWASLERYAAALKTSFGEIFSAAAKTATELGLTADEALKEEEARAPDCTNLSCHDGLAPRKTDPDEGDVDMEPCPACGGPSEARGN